MVWKSFGKAQFCPKLCGNCAFLHNFHTKKLGKIAVFYVVIISSQLTKNLFPSDNEDLLSN